ncbi:MAG: LysE family translocator [Magnetovibrio sp.]|nr:LysE family translocator [Magnetovibrio sp.]
MALEVWFSFFVVTVITVVSPGPAVLLAVTHGAQFGARRAVFPVLGNVTGLAIIITASAVGIGSILQASSEAFFWLRIVGGLYLIFLGVKLLRSSSQIMTMDVQPKSRTRTYLQGITLALSNPKALLFIGALFPHFIDVSNPALPQFMVMGATMMTISFCSLMTYAMLSNSLIEKGKASLIGKANKVTGALFVLFGLALAREAVKDF